jgi:phage baseplate assembly protein W
MADYGKDFLLASDDIVFTPDGDIELVSGAACVAQDIDRTLKTTPGALYWDKDTGSTLLYMLNDSESEAAAVIAELERVAIADARVNPETVNAYQTAPGKFRLEFTPPRALKPETLEYDLTKGSDA